MRECKFVVNLHEVAEAFAMIDYVREITTKEVL